MKVLLVDNHDSFTYNLAQLIEQAGCNDLTIIRNESPEFETSRYDKFIFSPGPGIPSEEAGLMKGIMQKHSGTKSILGICLGHQAIAEYFSATLLNMKKVYHGIKTIIKLNDPSDYIFKGLSETLYGGLYHSWNVCTENFPDCLNITAMSQDEVIMGIAHKTFDIKGLQFHPESIMTEQGLTIIRNWLRYYAK